MAYLYRIFTYIKNSIKVIKHGGVVSININNVNSEHALSGKVALITGGTSGFGLAIAKQFLANGAKVVISGRNENKLNDVLKELNTVNVKGLIWDLNDVTTATIMLNKAISLFGQIDIAVNNAGVWTGKAWNHISEKDWDSILDTNTKGLFFIGQAEGAYFSSRKEINKIINITSMEGVLAGFGPYYASKWGANGLTKGLAKQLAHTNTIVNAIAPRPAKTNINAGLFEGQEDNFYNPDTRSRTGRMVLVEEVANLAAFLASDNANSILGQVIVIDGGISLN